MQVRPWTRRAFTVAAVSAASVMGRPLGVLAGGLRRVLHIPRLRHKASSLSGKLREWEVLFRFASVLGRNDVRALARLAVSGSPLKRELESAERERRIKRHYDIHQSWSLGLMDAISSAVGLSIELPKLRKTGSPVLLMARHSSLIDAPLGAFVAFSSGRRPKYIVMEELRWWPYLDVIGDRLPNVFVRRGGGVPAEELTNLVTQLDPNDVVILLPEGTFYNPVRLKKGLERLSREDRPDLVARYSDNRYLLPPRTGAFEAISLTDHGAMDIALMTFGPMSGLDTLRSLLSELPLDRGLEFDLETFSRQDLPPGGTGLVEWLHDQWVELERKTRRFEN